MCCSDASNAQAGLSLRWPSEVVSSSWLGLEQNNVHLSFSVQGNCIPVRCSIYIYIYENFAKNLTTLCLRKMVLGSDNTNGFFSTDEDLARCANIVQDRE